MASSSLSSSSSLNHSIPLSKLVIPGISQRKDFSLLPSRTALLVIDVQNVLSTLDQEEKETTSFAANTNNNDKEEERENQYLYHTALPKAIPNMVRLIRTLRSLRDNNNTTTSTTTTTAPPSPPRYGYEVIFTYLEALTSDYRDISLDYKLSGPKLSTHLPNRWNSPAKFDKLPVDLQPQIQQQQQGQGRGDIVIPKTSSSPFSSTNLQYVLKNLHIEQLVVCGQLTDQCVLGTVRDAADLGYFVTVVEDACAALSVAEHRRGLEGMSGFARVLGVNDIIKELLEGEEEMKEVKEEKKDEGDKQLDDTTAPDTANTTITTNIMVERSNTQRRFKLKPPSLHQSSITTDNNSNNNGMAEALIHTLRISGVEFLRYAALDVGNSIRTKATPLARINNNLSTTTVTKSQALNRGMSIAKVCMAGLPTYADVILPDTCLDSRDVLTVKPDWSTMRVLPYAPKSAMVMGTLHDRTLLGGEGGGGDLSEFCTRGLLQRLLESAKEQLGLGFRIGAELEFSLQKRRRRRNDNNDIDNNNDNDYYEPVDTSLFAHPTILNQYETFFSDLHSQLQRQDIPIIEQLHAESSSGQVEIVLRYRDDPIRLADDILYTKETIVACAYSHHLRAVFRPKPMVDGAGNGMHVHLSLYDCRSVQRRNIFSPTSLPRNDDNDDDDDDTKIISNIGGSFMEGILRHLPALTALVMASGESYARVGPGCWTGYDVRWGVEEKEVPLRVCLDDAADDDEVVLGNRSGGRRRSRSRRMVASNVELKLLDHTANVYLALAGILRAGIDGICEGMELRRAGVTIIDDDDDDDASISVGEALPQSLDESLDCLQEDTVLMDLLGEGLSTSYIAVKRAEFQHYRSRKKSS